MNKIVKKNDLKQWEKHKVESPFFAAGTLRDALDGKGIQLSETLWGLSDFAAAHKGQLSSNRSIAREQIMKILKSQTWYVVLERPFAPLFPEALSIKDGHQGIIFGGTQRTRLEPEQHYTPPPPLTMGRYIPEDGLTVYLGGAGMEGDYISSQIEKLLTVGINGAVAGKITEGLPGDAAAVLKYRYPARSISGISSTGPYKISTDWSLKALGINRQLPQNGQFNLIGYSWGSLVAHKPPSSMRKKGRPLIIWYSLALRYRSNF
ncbi:hypothetical protein [Pseudomonas gingeri]|uniref:hypothetical protein n=1 Tax=Pseudomonas gingeri TaxID=117681 RepID=UPI0015A08054|nr:hypothetical protein [Pseudomonas gingeri]NWD08922.1 hypothetical protein [Pseudomonas gingeri]NWE36200.1 hypothetical protein [Pseudomonas gingeri]NWE60360.1 hypothetical protein [Pseudomonas gingeri]NWF05864.1 hypothetical protein [Pseudomonas gingeri]